MTSATKREEPEQEPEKRRKPGPEPEHLVIPEEDAEEALDLLLGKKKPAPPEEGQVGEEPEGEAK